jgi:DNA-binding transcriptional regulator LsrR (DeoR family)
MRRLDGGASTTRNGEATPAPGAVEGLTKLELSSIICHYFCSGHPPAEIRRRLAEDHKQTVNREFIYRALAKAAREERLSYSAPTAFRLTQQMREAYPRLQGVRVVETVLMDDVARAGAKMLLELLQQHFAGAEAHLGLSGGHAMRTLAFEFSRLLREASVALPKKIVFHAMVAGFDVFDPTTDPNAFFTYFVNDPALVPEIGFVGLHAPPVVPPEQASQLRNLDGVSQSYKEAKKLDIIVTSARDWRDEHSALRRMLQNSPDVLDAFEQAGAVGDLLWRPIGPNGPIEIDAPRAMTLKDLHELADFVKSGKRVLLALGPCSQCLATKTEIARIVLNQEQRLISHLVLDSRAAHELTANKVQAQAAPGRGG